MPAHTITLDRSQAAACKRLLSAGKEPGQYWLPGDLFGRPEDRPLLFALHRLALRGLLRYGAEVRGQRSVSVSVQLWEELQRRGNVGLSCCFCGVVVGDDDETCSDCGRDLPPW